MGVLNGIWSKRNVTGSVIAQGQNSLTFFPDRHTNAIPVRFESWKIIMREIDMKRSPCSRAMIVVTLAAFFLSACVTTAQRNIENFERRSSTLRILFMPMDVELSELGAGGITEPKVEWTNLALKHMKTSIKKTFESRNGYLIPYVEPERDSAEARDHIQLVKLHGAIGNTILRQRFRPLPTKGETLSWTLGDDAKLLRGLGQADYALFVFMRDSYTSPGRAAAIVVAAVLGVGLRGGVQVGFASLVDLHTGEIVWFSPVARGSGDLRNPEDAEESIKLLMSELPD